MTLEVSTDTGRIDVDRVHRWLSEDAYWALGRPREVVERAIAGSLNVGAYAAGGAQVGYARVVTDRASFAWLCDVYVDPGSRGTGVGRSLLTAVSAELADLRIKRALLATADAHALYAEFGFEPLGETRTWMIRSFEG